MTAAIHGSSLFRAYVHNDTCPDNCLMTADGVRLIDFERGGYHHCLVDVAYYRLGMPHCCWAGRLPSDVVVNLEQRNRENIASFIPEAADIRRFGSALTDACAYWNISSGIWMLDKNFAADFNWGNSSWRQRVLFRLEQFATATEEFHYLPVMGDAARETLRILGSHWISAPLPLFPSFSSKLRNAYRYGAPADFWPHRPQPL